MFLSFFDHYKTLKIDHFLIKKSIKKRPKTRFYEKWPRQRKHRKTCQKSGYFTVKLLLITPPYFHFFLDVPNVYKYIGINDQFGCSGFRSVFDHL